MQCSGEAEFTTDIPTINGELAAAFVLTKQVKFKNTIPCPIVLANSILIVLIVSLLYTTQANAEVVSIDSSAAEVF